MVDTMKKLTAGALAALVLVLALAPGVAWAASAPAVTLAGDAAGNVAVGLQLPESGRDDVRALKLTLEVGAEAGTVDAGFAFAGSLDGATVKEARVQPVDGVQRVNVYVASQDANLFANRELSLGTLTLAAEDGATVSVKAVGLEAVNAAHGSVSALDAGIDLSADAPEVTVTVPAAGDVPADPPTGGDTESGDEPSDDDAGTTPGSDADYDASANRSPGAPSGTDSSLVTTGDVLAPMTAACAAAACAAAIAAIAALTRRRAQR